MTDAQSLFYNNYAQGIRALSFDEQLQLFELITAYVRMNMATQQERKPLRLSQLKRRDLLKCDSEELVDIKVWEWNEPNNFRL